MINYSVYGGIQTHGYLTPMANAAEYKTLFNEMVVNDNASLLPNNPLFKKPIPDTIAMAIQIGWALYFVLLPSRIMNFLSVEEMRKHNMLFLPTTLIRMGLF